MGTRKGNLRMNMTIVCYIHVVYIMAWKLQKETYYIAQLVNINNVSIKRGEERHHENNLPMSCIRHPMSNQPVFLSTLTW